MAHVASLSSDSQVVEHLLEGKGEAKFGEGLQGDRGSATPFFLESFLAKSLAESFPSRNSRSAPAHSCQVSRLCSLCCPAGPAVKEVLCPSDKVTRRSKDDPPQQTFQKLSTDLDRCMQKSRVAAGEQRL